MSDGENIGSPFAFYAFLQLFEYFREDGDKLRKDKTDNEEYFYKVCKEIYPNFDSVDLESKVSLFVTWKKKSVHTHHSDPYALRGCIGTFSKLPILICLEKYSLIAALEDTRFPPISKDELPKLKCSTNLLQHFKVIYDGRWKRGSINNWEIGKHGIELRFKHPKIGKLLSATFLPEVMVEQKWNQEETFLNLIEKAGCWDYVNEVFDHHEKYFVEVIRYEGLKSSITYNDFIEKLEKTTE